MEPLTQTCGGSVVDTFALGPTGNMQNPNFVIFHNGRQEIRIFADNDGTLEPKLWGSVIDTFALGPLGTV